MGKTYIIAEAGVNHNGSLATAKQLIDAAAQAGADAVKFQSFRADKLVSRAAPKAAYQIVNTGVAETQYVMLKKLELSAEDHRELIEHCRERSIQFLSTPFDLDSLALLVMECQIPLIKISSGDITNAVLLLEAARTGRPVILSTGMSTLADVEAALEVLAFGYTASPGIPPSRGAFRTAYASSPGQEALQKNVTLLHCTTEYPAPFAEVNLRVMDTLGAAFGLKVGLSDHTPGISVAIGAVAKGATVIEKHFTLDKTMPGPDHKASLEPDELAALVQGIRQVELALGSEMKIPTVSEMKNMSVARKSLVAACAIEKGELFTAENLAVKRAGEGIPPLYYWDWIGRRAGRRYAPDELIDF